MERYLQALEDSGFVESLQEPRFNGRVGPDEGMEHGGSGAGRVKEGELEQGGLEKGGPARAQEVFDQKVHKLLLCRILRVEGPQASQA